MQRNTPVNVHWEGYSTRIYVMIPPWIRLNRRIIRNAMADHLGIQRFNAPFTWERAEIVS